MILSGKVPGSALQSSRVRPVNRCGRLWGALFLGVMFSVPLNLVWIQAAEATPARPHLSGSYYMATTSTATANSLGCASGSYDTSHGFTSRLDILDFGGQNSSATGTVGVNGTPFTNRQIESISEDYALGYYNCSGFAQIITIAVATNNSLGAVSTFGGVTWGNMVDTVTASSYGQAVASRVTFWGGNDFEDWYPSTSDGAAGNWAQGFDSATNLLYVDFGDASGCPTDHIEGGNGAVCNAVNSNFDQHAYWYLSWGEAAALSAPEVYNTAMPLQWTQICRYGYYNRSSGITFKGPMTYNATHGYLSADSSWSYFWNDLAGTVCGQTPPYEVWQKDGEA